jgi:rod shape-determining protein MreC
MNGPSTNRLMGIPDIRRRSGYLLLAVVIGHLILISAQVNSGSGVPVLEAVSFGVFAEIQRTSAAMTGGVRGFWNEYVALRAARSQNERLLQELAALQVRLQEERALVLDARRMRELLDMRERLPLSTTAAEIIAGSAIPSFRTVTIDKGTADGLSADLAVIAPAGVVGRVVMPAARAARVQLLIDGNAAAGAMIERSRAQGIVMGTGDDGLRMEYVLSTADVVPGDRVVTSGLDGIYPKGLVIGEVESIETTGRPYVLLRVRPAVDFSKLEEVLVVLSRPISGAAGAIE